MKMNPAQEEAANWDGGPMLVLAGAGAGKTATLTRTAANLIGNGIPASAILIQTFTKKAGNELKERLESLLGPIAHEIFAGTFHSFCWNVMRSEIVQYKGKSVDEVVIKDYKALSILEEIFKAEAEAAYARGEKVPPEEDTPNVLKRFGLAKSNLIYPSDEANAAAYFGRILGDHDGRRMAGIYKSYCLKVKSLGLTDFDDWLLITYSLFMNNTDVLSRFRNRFQYIMSDEVQDQNVAQSEILKLLAGDQGNIFLVGDVKQSIFGFRGASPEATVMDFRNTYPEGRIVYLKENYRCDGEIIKIANNLTEHMKSIPELYRGSLVATKECKNPPEVYACSASDEEGIQVVSKIKEAIDSGVSPEKCAILYRTNAQSIYPEQALIEAKIPYVVLGGTSFYERREVLDMVAYLELCSNSNTIAASDACKRVINYASSRFSKTHEDRSGKPLHTHMLGKEFIAGLVAMARARGAQCMGVLKEYAYGPKIWGTQRDGVEDFLWIVSRMRSLQEDGKGPADIARWVFDTVYSNYLANSKADESELEDGRRENCNQLIADLGRFNSVPSALAYIRHLREQNERNKKENANAVQLMSLHRSKGLEFDYVFFIGMNENVIPHSRGDVEEERRLAYVGVTRAKTYLMITWSEGRGEPSRFLGELGFADYLMGEEAEEEESQDSWVDRMDDAMVKAESAMVYDEIDPRLALLEGLEEIEVDDSTPGATTTAFLAPWENPDLEEIAIN